MFIIKSWFIKYYQATYTTNDLWQVKQNNLKDIHRKIVQIPSSLSPLSNTCVENDKIYSQTYKRFYISYQYYNNTLDNNLQ